jgi:diguanylate cyclase (GGDEF)-like protein/PAS domain S-box-containing protein
MHLPGQKWLSRLFRRSATDKFFVPGSILPIAEAGRPLNQQEAERLFRHIHAFLRDTSDSVLFLDSDWRITFLNTRATEELHDGPALLGRCLWDAIPEARGTIFEERYRLAVAQHSLEVFEAYFEPLAAWFEVHAIPVERGLTVIFRNINARRAAAEALRERERELATVFGQTMVGILHRDLEHRVLMVNDRYCEIVGRGREELDGLSPDVFIHPDDYKLGASLFEDHSKTGQPFQVETRYIRPDGSVLWCDVNVSFVRDEDGKVTSSIVVAEDIHARKLAEEQADESRRQLATLIHNLPGLVYRCSVAPPWSFSFMSEGAEELTGYSADDFMRQKLSWSDLIHPDDLEDVERTVLNGVEERRPFSIVYRIITLKGETRWVNERGQCIRNTRDADVFLEGIINDVTSQKEAQERISWTAHHDSLTQLPNRLLFQERLDQALQQSARTGRKAGLVLIDLDHLKEVNDTSGHDAGDAVLQTVADRLRQSVRTGDTVARNGGDEFAIVLPDITGVDDVNSVIAPVVERLRMPLVYAGQMLDCSASIGISIWPDYGVETADLLKQADIALYTAKSNGRGRVVFFEPALRTDAHERAQMRSVARQAIDNHQLVPFYQPKVHLDSGRLAGFEALLRWRNPTGGIEPPSTIQAAFDDPYLATAIGRQMQDLAIADMRRWLDGGVDFGHVAVNASAAEFRSSDFADSLLERLRVLGIAPRYLEIEITETVFFGRGAEHVETILRTLCEEGVRIALDDFGTGYASLSHLKQFPVDLIKIDQSFVRDLADNPDDTAILFAVLNLGQNLGIDTIAEGIETEIQAEFLRAQGCDMGQGYLFGKAKPASDIPALVASWAPERHGTRPQHQARDQSGLDWA